VLFSFGVFVWDCAFLTQKQKEKPKQTALNPMSNSILDTEVGGTFMGKPLDVTEQFLDDM
jgi:hypothetical protein